MCIHASRRDKQIADHALAAFIDEEGISHHVAAFHCCITRQDLRIHVTQDHVRGVAVIPAKHAAPRLDLLIEQGAEVAGREMPEVENLHSIQLMRPAENGGSHRRVTRGRSASLVRSGRRSKLRLGAESHLERQLTTEALALRSGRLARVERGCSLRALPRPVLIGGSSGPLVKVSQVRPCRSVVRRELYCGLGGCDSPR